LYSKAKKGAYPLEKHIEIDVYNDCADCVKFELAETVNDAAKWLRDNGFYYREENDIVRNNAGHFVVVWLFGVSITHKVIKFL
jgi:hypothetical protein